VLKSAELPTPSAKPVVPALPARVTTEQTGGGGEGEGLALGLALGVGEGQEGPPGQGRQAALPGAAHAPGAQHAAAPASE
jgi:hypothetical protein